MDIFSQPKLQASVQIKHHYGLCFCKSVKEPQIFSGYAKDCYASERMEWLFNFNAHNPPRYILKTWGEKTSAGFIGLKLYLFHDSGLWLFSLTGPFILLFRHLVCVFLLSSKPIWAWHFFMHV